MAKEKARVEDTVKDIIKTGIDFRERMVLAKSKEAHIVKPSNIDGSYLTNDTDGSTSITITQKDTHTLTHYLGRIPQDILILEQTAFANIWMSDKQAHTVTLRAGSIQCEPIDNDYIHTAITGTGEIQIITTDITDPDCPRNISITTTDVSSPFGAIKIIGIDKNRASLSENITILAGGTRNGSKKFATVSSITIPAGVSSDDTIKIGIGNVLDDIKLKIILI